MWQNEKPSMVLGTEAQEVSSPMAHQEIGFELLLAELIAQIQDVCPHLWQIASLRKSVAQYGNAYFFYNQAGEFCLLTTDL